MQEHKARTTIHLPTQLYRDIQRMAYKAGKPPVMMVEDFVRRVVEAQQHDAKANQGTGAGLMELAQLGIKGGPSDLSVKADDYLYGDR